MGFFDRNREELAAKGFDESRLPPGQYLTDRFPVLHVGDVPTYKPGEWSLTIDGLVDNSFSLSLDELRALPSTKIKTDIHCVTKWSKFDMVWAGVRVRDLFEMAKISTSATHVMGHAEYGYTANVPLADMMRDDSLVVYQYEGEDIEPIHVAPCDYWFQIYISGNHQSGCVALNFVTPTHQVFGSKMDITCTVIRF